MVLVLVPERDVEMWRNAASFIAPRGGSVVVASHDCSGDAFRGHRVIAHVEDRAHGTAPVLEGFHKQDLVFSAERYGGYNICPAHIRVFVREHVCDLAPPKPTTGPGARSDGGVVLWPIDMFHGLGTRVSRDEPEVVEFLYEAVRGDGPMWVCPGYPFLVPVAPYKFRSLAANYVHGLLCSSVDEPGSWVVLERTNILRLLGHPGDVPWSELFKVMGVRPAAAILDWLCVFSASLPVRVGK